MNSDRRSNQCTRRSLAILNLRLVSLSQCLSYQVPMQSSQAKPIADIHVAYAFAHCTVMLIYAEYAHCRIVLIWYKRIVYYMTTLLLLNYAYFSPNHLHHIVTAQTARRAVVEGPLLRLHIEHGVRVGSDVNLALLLHLDKADVAFSTTNHRTFVLSLA